MSSNPFEHDFMTKPYEHLHEVLLEHRAKSIDALAHGSLADVNKFYIQRGYLQAVEEMLQAIIDMDKSLIAKEKAN